MNIGSPVRLNGAIGILTGKYGNFCVVNMKNVKKHCSIDELFVLSQFCVGDKVILNATIDQENFGLIGTLKEYLPWFDTNAWNISVEGKSQIVYYDEDGFIHQSCKMLIEETKEIGWQL